MDLADVINQTPGVRVVKGIVENITGDTLTMTYLGSSVPGVSHFDQYTPVVGDICMALVIPRGGWIALGSINGTGAGNGSVPTAPTTGIVVAQGFATAVLSLGAYTWLPGQFAQGPDRAGCWFYDTADFTPYTDYELASFEVEVTRTSGGPPELRLHNNPGPADPLVFADQQPFIAPGTLEAGSPTWVAAPVGWGQMLASGRARGVGIGLSQHNGIYAGTGRLRFTTI